MMIAVTFGAIGFPVIYALSRNLRRPLRWSLHVKLTLVTFALLLVGGAVAYFILEFNNPRTMADFDVGQRILQSFFISTMARSGGFATLDISQLDGSSLLVTDMLMFVGGGSASTAGGIKVTTLAILFLAAFAEARGSEAMEAYDRRIPSDVLRLAVSVVLWGATLVAGATIILHAHQRRASRLRAVRRDQRLRDLRAEHRIHAGIERRVPIRARGHHVRRSDRYCDSGCGTRGQHPATAVPASGREAHRWLTRLRMMRRYS